MESLFKKGDLPDGRWARLIETFESLGLPYETDSTHLQGDYATTDEKVLVAAFERGRARYHKKADNPSPGVTDAREKTGNSYTTSLTDTDGQHYQIQWVFNQLELLLWIQYKLIP